MTEKPFKIFEQPTTKDGSLIIVQTGSLEDLDVKVYNINDVVDMLNEQNWKIKDLEIELEDMTIIKDKFKKESKDYLEMYLDAKTQLSKLMGKSLAKSLNLRLCLQKHYRYAYNQRQKNLDNATVAHAYDVLRVTIRDIADELGVDLDD